MILGIANVGLGLVTHSSVLGKSVIASFDVDAPSGREMNLALVTSDAGVFDVDWGDGTVSEDVASSTNATSLTHTYASAYSGIVKILASAPREITEFRSTSGYWSFDISNLPRGLTYYHNTGSNTTTGDISNLPSGLTYYRNTSYNTTTGDISNLPSGLTFYHNEGYNTTTGDISNLPSGLTFYRNTGYNTTTGDISNLPSGLTYYRNTGYNTVTASTTSWGAKTTFESFYQQGAALAQAPVDNMLVALTNVTTWTGYKQVDVSGSNAAPSATGQAAVTTILANGASSVATN